MQFAPLAFDYQSTTPCSTEVVEAMKPYWNEFWGNPSSRQNRLGVHASAAINLARETIANCLEIEATNIIFTSGATEANNLSLLGYARAKALDSGFPGHLITLKTEHNSVLYPLRQLRLEGFQLTELDTESDGLISIDRLNQAFQNDTFMVSIMLANNEIGVIQPIAKIAELCKERGVVFHTDAAQGFGYIPLEPKSIGIDLMSISAHKIYGPKGIGALILKDHVPLQPLQWGGGQENGLRSGTLPVPLVVGMAKAAEIAIAELEIRNSHLKNLRDHLWKGLRRNIENLTLNGSIKERLPHNLNITIHGVKGSRLHSQLKPFISCSHGSSCNQGSPSHVLLALGLTKKETEASIRLSLGKDTNMLQVEKTIEVISKIASALRI
tara:strand:+ start:415 stop:1563 length:1149 start_codon:yes stop_codon:yes gene_type:complete